ACDYFERYSRTFVDYFLEPRLGLFCGYGRNDFSLAWMLWGAAGRHPWANHWWSFQERGVGKLTWALGRHLGQDAGVDYRLGHAVQSVHVRADGVTIDCTDGGGAAHSLAADAVVMAVPGTRVSGLMPDLDDQRRAFFDRVTYSGHHIA